MKNLPLYLNILQRNSNSPGRLFVADDSSSVCQGG
jgi:hypothetical protein